MPVLNLMRPARREVHLKPYLNQSIRLHAVNSHLSNQQRQAIKPACNASIDRKLPRRNENIVASMRASSVLPSCRQPSQASQHAQGRAKDRQQLPPKSALPVRDLARLQCHLGIAHTLQHSAQAHRAGDGDGSNSSPLAIISFTTSSVI